MREIVDTGIYIANKLVPSESHRVENGICKYCGEVV
jgi:hypothetical protein